MSEFFVTPFTKQDLKKCFEHATSFTKPHSSLGSHRLAYSLEDEAVTQWFIQLAQYYGLNVRTDLVGNVYARLPGKQSSLPVIATGSHLDTVPQGGHYDGVIGVLTGLYALLQYQPFTLNRDVELILFRAEESSRFGFSCIGSKAVTGRIDVEKWKKNIDSAGQNVFEVIATNGYANAEQIINANCELPEKYLGAFIEVHIEQGRVLENKQKRIGIVNGIAAPTRYHVVIEGHADHSGATPMDQRSDALVASAQIIHALQQAAYAELPYNTVGTVGKLDVQPNSMNVIPGHVSFFVDIRGIDTESIARVIDKLMLAIDSAATSNHCQATVREISKELPVKLNDDLCNMIGDICLSHNIPAMSMLSGAGHDAMNIASKCPTAMIFIPSQAGISHYPDEYSQWGDIELAADLLTEVLGNLASQKF